MRGVGKTELERFKDEVLDERGIGSRKCGNIESREDPEGEKNDNPLTVWRHLHHALTAVIGRDWLDPFAVLRGQIGSRQITATRIRGGDDLSCQFAFIKQVSAVLAAFRSNTSVENGSSRCRARNSKV